MVLAIARVEMEYDLEGDWAPGARSGGQFDGRGHSGEDAAERAGDAESAESAESAVNAPRLPCSASPPASSPTASPPNSLLHSDP